ncbi:MAG: SET domain-containing protein-lysine N-methyltransferase [Anaerolineaceae bacterium]|nr:SET domain-containing protein-lysine N-methyltransferase [Anaerolineaceae bacterium]
MADQPTCYTSPKLAARYLPEKGFSGLFAVEPVATDELLAIYMGDLIDGARLAELPPAAQVHILQIEEDHYIAPLQEEPAHFVNHSCNPNAWFHGQVTVIARRDIAPGEEICFDYAMCDGSPYDEFTCLCGTPDCRGRISGDDWKRPELWERYAGHFSPYLQRRIDRLKG